MMSIDSVMGTARFTPMPRMSELQGYGDSGNPRLIYNLDADDFELETSKAVGSAV